MDCYDDEYDGLEYDKSRGWIYMVDYYTYSEIDVKELEWIWKPYIVRGNLNIIVGEGGVGKIYLTTGLSSAISRGEKIPFSNDKFKVENVILQNAEDDIEATVLPRLLSNNADTEKIGFLMSIVIYFQFKI